MNAIPSVSHSPRNRLLILVFAVALLANQAHSAAAQDDPSELTDADYAAERIVDLTVELSHHKVINRVNAVRDLHALGPEARSAIPRLIDLLEDNAEFTEYSRPISVRTYASLALSAMESEAVEVLLRRYPDLDPTVQREVLRIASRIGPKARGFLPDALKLYRAAADEDEQVELLRIIAAIDPTGEEVLPLVFNIIRIGKTEQLRRTAVECLARPDYSDIPWHESMMAKDWYQERFDIQRAVTVDLEEALRDPSANVRGPAATALGTHREAAHRNIQQLVKLLADDRTFGIAVSDHLFYDSTVANAAATALTQFPEAADDILPALVRAKVSQSTMHQAIEKMVFDVGRPMQILLPLMNDDQHRSAVMVVLARLGKRARPAIKRLESYAIDSSPLRDHARITLACLDPEGHPECFEFVNSRLAGSQRSHVCDFLAAIGPPAAFAIPFLLPHILNPETKSRDKVNWDVVGAIQSIDPNSVPPLPQMMEHLPQEWSLDRKSLEDDLVRCGDVVVPLLIEELKQPTKLMQRRISCLTILERLRATSAVPAIILHADSECPEVRLAVASALGALAADPDVALPVLKQLLSDPRIRVRVVAALSCSQFADAATPVVPALIEKLTDSSIDVQVAAATALGQLKFTEAIPALREFARSKNPLIRQTALTALERIERAEY